MVYVRRLSAQNYRCFSEFSAALEPGVNVVAGSNGAGKTSALRAVVCALAPFAQQCRAEAGELAADDVRRQAVTYGRRVRFERCQPSECRVELQCGRQTQEFSQKRQNEVAAPSFSGRSDGVEEAVGVALPLLAFYQANRQWLTPKALSEIEAASCRDSRRDGYRGWCNASDCPSAFYQWMIGRSIERLKLAVDRQVGFWQVEDDELAEVNRALKKALPGEFESIAYDMAAKAVVVKISGKYKEFTALSDGERSFIGLFADIARRMCLLNPQFGDEVIEKTNGIVLIDELDAHLHPIWQRKIVRGLQAAFPKVQFIVTMNSSAILREVPQQNLLWLSEGKIVQKRIEAIRQSDFEGRSAPWDLKAERLSLNGEDRCMKNQH